MLYLVPRLWSGENWIRLSFCCWILGYNQCNWSIILDVCVRALVPNFVFHYVQTSNWKHSKQLILFIRILLRNVVVRSTVDIRIEVFYLCELLFNLLIWVTRRKKSAFLWSTSLKYTNKVWNLKYHISSHRMCALFSLRKIELIL